VDCTFEESVTGMQEASCGLRVLLEAGCVFKRMLYGRIREDSRKTCGQVRGLGKGGSAYFTLRCGSK